MRSTEVTAPAIEAARELHLIVRAGAEYHTIDVRAASKRGIYVANCPGRNASAVAELVIGLMVSLDRRIPDAVASLRAGKWERAEFGKAQGLHGKTIGIAGLGAVGREVAARAKAFGLHVVGWGKSFTPAKASELGIEHAATIDQLAVRSNILTVHLALTDRTRKIVGERVFEQLAGARDGPQPGARRPRRLCRPPQSGRRARAARRVRRLPGRAARHEDVR